MVVYILLAENYEIPASENIPVLINIYDHALRLILKKPENLERYTITKSDNNKEEKITSVTLLAMLL